MVIKHVFRWDLDKTYLRTEFDRPRDLLKSMLESATDKQAYPGATALLRALRQTDGHYICIVSGSPTQMHKVLSAKLALDGVTHDEFVLKNNLRNLARGRFRALRSQVPYKLPTILQSRVNLNTTPPETLFGDDAEADAIIYNLYADILAGEVPLDELERIMRAARAYDSEVELTLALARQVIHQDSVRRILIHLDQRTPTAHFAHFGRRVVPIYNYFQAALILYADGLLSARQVLFVGVEMLRSREYEVPTLANSLQDLIRRRRIDVEVARKLASEAATTGDALAGQEGLPPFDRLAEVFASRVRQLGALPPIVPPVERPRLDYVSLVDQEHLERNKKQRERRRSRR